MSQWPSALVGLRRLLSAAKQRGIGLNAQVRWTAGAAPTLCTGHPSLAEWLLVLLRSLRGAGVGRLLLVSVAFQLEMEQSA